jgi:hypothetical protein
MSERVWGEELKRLSARGIAALLTRCSWRLGAFYFYFGEPEPREAEALCRAVGAVASFAGGGCQTDEDGEALKDAGLRSLKGGMGVLAAVSHAARFAYEAGGIDILGESAKHNAALFAGESVLMYRCTLTDSKAEGALASDFARLESAEGQAFPAPGGAVDLGQLGPLWPRGEPFWFAGGEQRWREAAEAGGWGLPPRPGAGE